MLQVLLTTCLCMLSAFAETVIVKNNCPIGLNIYIDQVDGGRIAPQSSLYITVSPQSSLRLTASLRGGTSANFFFPDNYYYIVRDALFFNVGASIAPADGTPTNGMCTTAICDYANCTDGYGSNPPFPPSDVIDVALDAPTPPLHACNDTSFEVTWCPSGILPGPPQPLSIPRALHPVGSSSKCIGVPGNSVTYGTPVQIYDCDGSVGQQWLFSRGTSQIRLIGTNFCWDAGDSRPAELIKLWECIPNLPQQTWVYTDNNFFALGGSTPDNGLCLDVTDGSLANGNQLQAYYCTTGSVNQLFVSCDGLT